MCKVCCKKNASAYVLWIIYSFVTDDGLKDNGERIIDTLKIQYGRWPFKTNGLEDNREQATSQGGGDDFKTNSLEVKNTMCYVSFPLVISKSPRDISIGIQ